MLNHRPTCSGLRGSRALWLSVSLATALLASLACTDDLSVSPMLDAGSDGATNPDAAVPIAGAPLLFNFRITDEDSSRDVVYFDSSEPITATTFGGFAVSGKSITGIHVASGENTGHYLVVESEFNFYDNNTISYSGAGTDLEDLDGNPLFEFTITYVENQLTEPDAPIDRYASVSGSGSKDGSSEANAWTLTQAFSDAVAGQTVWVKAGEYGNLHLTIGHDGTLTSPIKFIGYKTTTGDISTPLADTFSYTTVAAAAAVDPTEYPVLTGNGSTAPNENFGILLSEASNVSIKNFQVRSYHNAIWVYDNSSNLYFENITVALNEGVGTSGGGNGFFAGATTTSHHIRVNKSLGIDNAGVHFRMFGEHNAIVNSKAWCGIDGDSSTDYYFSWYKATHSVFHGNSAIRVGDIQHKGHAFGLKQWGTYNLISNNYSRNISENIYFAREGSAYNVAKHNTVEGDLAVGRIPTALVVRGGAHDNIFEYNEARSVRSCITNWMSNESVMESNVASKNNIYRNNICSDFRTGVSHSNQALILGGDYYIDGVKIYNNTFVLGEAGGELILDTSRAPLDLLFVNCEFKNNNVYAEDSGFVMYGSSSQDPCGAYKCGELQYEQGYNNYYNEAGAMADFPSEAAGNMGNVAVNPGFSDQVDWVPTNSALNIGLSGYVSHDINFKQRKTTPANAVTVGALEIDSAGRSRDR